MASKGFTKDDLVARFWDLDEKIKALDASLKPLQDERDALHASIANRDAELSEGIRKLMGQRFDLQQEQVMMSKAVNGRVGTDASTPWDADTAAASRAEADAAAEAAPAA